MNKSNTETKGIFFLAIGIIATAYLFQLFLMAYIVDYCCGFAGILPWAILLGCVLFVEILLFLLYTLKEKPKIFSIYFGILFSCISFVAIVSFMGKGSATEISLVLPLVILTLVLLGFWQIYNCKKQQWSKIRTSALLISMVYVIAILPLFYLFPRIPGPLTYLITYFVAILILNWITTRK